MPTATARVDRPVTCSRRRVHFRHGFPQLAVQDQLHGANHRRRVIRRSLEEKNVHRTLLHRLTHSLIVVAAAASWAACSEKSPLGPEHQSAASGGARSGADTGDASFDYDKDGPDLTGCEQLRVLDGSHVVLHAYARGVQTYRWSGTAWGFVSPAAALFSDRKGKSTVAIHYAGPTWESLNGSKVVAAVQQRCTPDANSIQWLLLGATTTEGPGVFDGVTFVQRLNTVGGNAPSTPGAIVGQLVNIPYTAEYFFYHP
jgi:hypothetical protein